MIEEQSFNYSQKAKITEALNKTVSQLDFEQITSKLKTSVVQMKAKSEDFTQKYTMGEDGKALQSDIDKLQTLLWTAVDSLNSTK